MIDDLRFSARTLLRNPGFTVTAVLTLALATGATTSIFAIVNGVLLRPLPFADPARLVQIQTIHQLTSAVHPLDLQAYRHSSASFEGLVGYAPATRHLQRGTAEPERLSGFMAERGLFSLLGVQPIAGRTFQADDPLDVVVISASLWQRRFGGDPSIVGKPVSLDGRPYTILGVMPETFQFPYRAASMMSGALPEARTDLWLPSDLPQRGLVTYVLGRLHRGVSPAVAATELSEIARRRQPPTPGVTGVRVQPLVEEVVGPVRRSLWILFAAVGLVLAAACANVANLLLARSAVRNREVAIRAALGAGHARVLRLFLAESLLLSIAGALAGLAIAHWGAALLVALGSAKIPRAHEVTLDWRVFGFVLVACVTTAVVVGLVPALTAARVDVQSATKDSSVQATMGRRSGSIRDAFVAVEVALAFVLASGATVIVREVIRLQNVNAGLVTENVLVLHATPRTVAQDYYAIERRVTQLPGIVAAGFSQLVPLQNWGWEADFAIRGRPPDPWSRTVAGLRYVTPGYFRTLGIPLVRGRALSDADHAEAPRVILVNEALARRYFPGEDPVGRETDRGTIVGVVGDVRGRGLDRLAEPELYYPAAQNVTMASDIGMALLVKTSVAPATIVNAVRSVVRDVNPNLAIFNVRTMDQVRADSMWELNLYRWLIGLFAALALALSAIGLYGVMSYTAASRTREFAIRLALGSNQVALARIVLRRGVCLGLLGIAWGAALSLAAARVLRNVAVGTQADATTFAAIGALLLAIALLACAVPAIRVCRVNPVATLRHD